jgi:hypothetical protein
LEGLRARGVPVELYSPGREKNYAALIFSKLYDPASQQLAKRLKQNGTRIVLDVCDNHFYNPFGLREYARAAEDLRHMTALADVIICSTQKLAEEFCRHTGLLRQPIVIGDPIEVLPETLERVSPVKRMLASLFRGRSVRQSVPTLLWFGSHGSPNAPCGMLDILNVADLLRRLHQAHPFELLVVSNNRKKYDTYIAPLPFDTRYAAWERRSFPKILRDSAAVIIPINRNPFTVCKTNNRLVMALHHGVPVIADGIPSYEEFRCFSFLDRWEEGLRDVLDDVGQGKRMAEEGRSYVTRHCMPEAIVTVWERAIREHILPTSAFANEENQLGRQMT